MQGGIKATPVLEKISKNNEYTVFVFKPFLMKRQWDDMWTQSVGDYRRILDCLALNWKEKSEN